MTDRTVFLVFGFDDYEYPCAPIKAFTSEADARALLDEIAAHEAKKPVVPYGDVSDAEYDAWDMANTQWRAAHPAGDACGHDGFRIRPLVLVESKP